VFTVTGLALSIGTMIYVASHRDGGSGTTRVLQPDPLAIGLSVPEFQLVDQDGAAQSQLLLEGHVTIIDFIFTNCPFACPGMTASMIELQNALEGTPVRFASFSVDPERDTPERMREFADRHESDTTRWTFLTGDLASVERIAHDALGFLLQQDSNLSIDLPDGSKMSNIMHPTKLILIGPDRHVLGFYDPHNDTDMRNLALRARLAAKEMATTAPR